jgi:transposase
MIYVGLDISAKMIDVAVWPSGETWSVAQTARGRARLVSRLQTLAPTLIAAEATGGYEQAIALTLDEAHLPVVGVNPRQVRDFAKALGQLAKTDRLDAVVIARFAEAVKPEPHPQPSEEMRRLHALRERRRQLVQMCTAEKQRLLQAAPVVQEAITAHIQWLEHAIAEADHELDEQVKAMPQQQEQRTRLQQVPGVGPQTSLALVIELPELGHITHKQVAALVGVAPLNHDSGTMHGKRMIWGGRAQVRTALYMATVSAMRYNPVIAPFAQRLREKGKAMKVVIVACMHKLLTILNAMLTSRSQWQAT